MAKLTEKEIRQGLIKAGVKNVREFGYPLACEKTILTDHVYQQLFKGMLESDENITVHEDIERVRLELLDEINKAIDNNKKGGVV